MSLRTHNGFGNPEVLLFQAPDIVQPKGDLVWGQRLPLTAPHRIVVIRDKGQVLGYGCIVHMLTQSPTGKVMHDKGIWHRLPQQTGLECSKSHDAFAAETLPIQPQGWVVRRDGTGWQWDLVKAVVFLRPESRPVGLV